MKPSVTKTTSLLRRPDSLFLKGEGGGFIQKTISGGKDGWPTAEKQTLPVGRRKQGESERPII